VYDASPRTVVKGFSRYPAPPRSEFAHARSRPVDTPSGEIRLVLMVARNVSSSVNVSCSVGRHCVSRSKFCRSKAELRPGSRAYMSALKL
jgi:hypothetical protein